MHVRFPHLDIVLSRRGIHFDVTNRGGLADHLFMDLAVRRDIDQDIRPHRRLAAEAPVRAQTPDASVAVLDGVPSA